MVDSQARLNAVKEKKVKKQTNIATNAHSFLPEDFQ